MAAALDEGNFTASLDDADGRPDFRRECAWRRLPCCQFVRWLRELSATFGFRFMLMLFVVQHLIKGLMAGGGISGLTGSPVQFLYRSVSNGPLTAAQRQTFFAVVVSPWSSKSLLGMMSDVLPLGGYRKISYMWITTIVAIVSCVVLTFFWPLSAQAATGFLFFVMLNSAMCDLLSEAKYAEKLKQHPEHGPALMSFVWGGIFAGKFLSVMLTGPVIQYFGAHWSYLIALIPLCAVLPVLYFNLLGEQRVPGSRLCNPDVITIRREWKMLTLSVVIFVSVMIMNTLSMNEFKVTTMVIVACVLGMIVLISFYFLVAQVIFRFGCFVFLQHMFTFSIEGATFLFFTDTKEAYPDGPHFSDLFYTTGVGVVGAFCSLLGIVIYNKFMHKWKYRSVFLVNNLVFMLVNLLNVVTYLRWNLTLGIPDEVFVLGSDAFQEIVQQWTWIPAIVLLSQLCPDGMEATMYAVLAGAQNLSANLGSYLGAFLLESLGVRPTGQPGDSKHFENLWLAALIVAIAPCIPLTLLKLVPDARQTDRILVPNMQYENLVEPELELHSTRATFSSVEE